MVRACLAVSPFKAQGLAPKQRPQTELSRRGYILSCLRGLVRPKYCGFSPFASLRTVRRGGANGLRMAAGDVSRLWLPTLVLYQPPHHLEQAALLFEPDTRNLRQPYVTVFDGYSVSESAERLEDPGIGFVAAQPQ